jgi:hypothetical protein
MTAPAKENPPRIRPGHAAFLTLNPLILNTLPLRLLPKPLTPHGTINRWNIQLDI